MSESWLVFEASHGDHIMPMRDFTPHRDSESCFCNPTVVLRNTTVRTMPYSLVEDDEHSYKWQWVRRIVTHNAQDGRPSPCQTEINQITGDRPELDLP